MAARLHAVLAAIDAANAADPSRVAREDGREAPAALAYGERMSERLARFRPDADDVLQIACRAQHLERWKLPRSDYPMDRKGYHAWRNEQKRRHAERVSAMMADAGYGEDDIARCAAIVRKEGIKRDADAQALEDVACLVFLEHHALDFAAGRDEEQLVDILAKTMSKMSTEGHAAAGALPLADGVRGLLETAARRIATENAPG